MNGPDAAPPTVMSGTGQEDPYRPALPLGTITPFQFVYCTTLFQFFGFLFFLSNCLASFSISVYVIAGVLLLVCYVVLAAQKYFQAPTMPRRKKATAKHVLPSSPLPARQQTPDATTKRSAAPSSHVSLSSRVTTP